MDQHVLLAEVVEDLGVARPDGARRERGVLQVRQVQPGELVPVVPVHPLAGAQHDVLVDLEVLHEDVQHAARHRLFDFEETQRAVAQLLEAAVHRLQQVVGLVLLDHHVRVPDDAEQVRRLQVGAREQVVQVGADDVLEERERQPRVRRHVGGDGDEPIQRGRNLHARELGAAAVADDDREVAAQVRDVRERMPGVERQRRQDRQDLGTEVVREVCRDLRRVLLGVEDVHALAGQGRAQLLPPAPLQRAHHLGGPGAGGSQLLLGVQAVRADVLDAGAILLQQRGDAHHEELVEVRGDDGQELDAFEQGMCRVERLVEHTLVELQPAQLTVDVERRMFEVGRIALGPVGASDGQPDATLGAASAYRAFLRRCCGVHALAS